jgi:hypothetical protein
MPRDSEEMAAISKDFGKNFPDEMLLSLRRHRFWLDD